MNPFRWFKGEGGGNSGSKKELPSDLTRPASGVPDVFYSPENADNLRQQIEGEELVVSKIPVGATVEVVTGNTKYTFVKGTAGDFVMSADPSKEWIENGKTIAAIHGALPGGGAILEKGIIREGAGVEYVYAKPGEINQARRANISPVRFVKVYYNEEKK